MITQAFCIAAKEDFLKGIHRTTSTYKIALYKSTANLDENTSAYTTQDEVSGKGYTAGGKALTGYSTGIDGTVAWIDWDDPVWTNSTITARGALIYNSSATGKPAIAVLLFDQDYVSVNGQFKAILPPPTGADALIRIG